MITCSIVLYKHVKSEVEALVQDFTKYCPEGILYLVDNSPTDCLRFEFTGERIKYLFCGKNLGYGSAHNQAIHRAGLRSTYHLVLNPDIHISPGLIPALVKYMDENPDVGLVMPKVLYENGQLQHLCKRLPQPADLFLRRFLPGFLKKPFQKWLDRYELKDKDYSKVMDVPNLSGCFMFMRTLALRQVGGFDERYFMYMEDTDLSRRIHEHFRTVYLPTQTIVHAYKRASYRNIKMLLHHSQSAVKYFNKWGWHNDQKRRMANRMLESLSRPAAVNAYNPGVFASENMPTLANS